MTHEPECPLNPLIEGDCECKRCLDFICVCVYVRSAYQRGREDASFDAEAVAEPFFLTRFNPIDEDAWAVFVNILAAARGEKA